MNWLDEPCACGHLGDVHIKLRSPELGKCLISGCYCKQFKAY